MMRSRLFYLWRIEDATGTSGTGFVAEGVQFSDGVCALRWLTDYSSTCTYASIADVTAIHGHGGKTRVMWEDLDFVHVPSGQPVFHDCCVLKPEADGSCTLFDGWPAPEADYMRIGRWMDEHRKPRPAGEGDSK